MAEKMEKWFCCEKREKNVIFTRGPKFFSAAEFFAQSGRIILKGVGNTIISLCSAGM
jgi:hypothetical protein